MHAVYDLSWLSCACSLSMRAINSGGKACAACSSKARLRFDLINAVFGVSVCLFLRVNPDHLHCVFDRINGNLV